MIRSVFGLTFLLVMSFSHCYGQAKTVRHFIETDSFIQMYELRLDVPFGQTFVKPAPCPSRHTIRFHTPDHAITTKVSEDTLGRMMRIILGMHGSSTLYDDPSHYLTELCPARNSSLALSMKLGEGSTCMDLSNLSVRSVDIASSSANVFLSYKQPNLERMQLLKIRSGMSKIVLRNLENARAERVKIDNGMGDTKIIIGENLHDSSLLNVSVGAGACVLVVHEKVPLKLILKNNFLSSVDIPDNFIKTGRNQYVSLAYKANPGKAMVVEVDLGIGSFSVISHE